jgi:hypothetical protein
VSDRNGTGDQLDLDKIEDDAAKAQRFIRDVRLDPTTTLALVAEVRRLRAQVADVLDLTAIAEKSGDPIWPHEVRDAVSP